MGNVKCSYYGIDIEDISIHFENHRVNLAEPPTPPMEKGVTYGRCENSYTFLDADQAQKLGLQLILAAAKKKALKGESLCR